MIRGIAVFDLDGTLLRGDTVCEVLAKPLGRIDEMKRFETFTTERDIEIGRAQMAQWYKGHPIDALRSHLQSACWAPGAHEAIRRLQEARVVVAIASITWKFAVRWFAEQLNVENYLGTDASANGDIVHVWGRDKARWLRELAADYGASPERTAAVGDSSGDVEMLRAAGLRFFVGASAAPELESMIYLPEADLRLVAERIIVEWAA
jgi:HAD superfamily phosphoserine phosphatase-like hydrolase